jgi:hypothetical protein
LLIAYFDYMKLLSQLVIFQKKVQDNRWGKGLGAVIDLHLISRSNPMQAGPQEAVVFAPSENESYHLGGDPYGFHDECI